MQRLKREMYYFLIWCASKIARQKTQQKQQTWNAFTLSTMDPKLAFIGSTGSGLQQYSLVHPAAGRDSGPSHKLHQWLSWVYPRLHFRGWSLACIYTDSYCTHMLLGSVQVLEAPMLFWCRSATCSFITVLWTSLISTLLVCQTGVKTVGQYTLGQKCCMSKKKAQAMKKLFPGKTLAEIFKVAFADRLLLGTDSRADNCHFLLWDRFTV